MAEAMLKMANSPPRYGLRKRASASGTQDGNGDYRGDARRGDDQDFDLEALLLEHEANGIREREKKRRRASLGSSVAVIPLDSLPSPCIGTILSMIGSARDLHSFVHTCRYVRSHFDHPDSTEIVLRAAAFESAGTKSGTFRQSILDSVLDSVKKKSIHVPPAMRLLRLVLAGTCERDELCYGYNLETRTAASLFRESARPFGLSICGMCLKACSSTVTNLSVNHDSSRVAWFKGRVPCPEITVGLHLQQHLMDGNGDADADDKSRPCGPIIHARHIRQIVTTYSPDDQENAVGRLVDRLYGEDGSPERVRYDSEADALTDLWDKTKADVAAYIQQKKRREEEERTTKREERIARRVVMCQVILDDLASRFQDQPGLLELVTAVTWHTETDKDEFSCLRFNCRYVDDLVRRMFRAPSYVTPKDVADEAATIRKNVTKLFDSPLLDVAWLMSTIASRAPMQTAIREYCLEHFTDRIECADVSGELIMPSPTKWLNCNGLDDRFFELLGENQEIAAIGRALCLKAGVLSEIFAKAVVPDQSSRGAKYRSLAKAVWDKRARSTIRECSTDDDFKSIYMSCKSEYGRLAKGAKQYLAHPATKAFVRELPTSSRGLPAGETFTRRDAVRQVFSPRSYVHGNWGNTAQSPFDHLVSRNFEALLAIHRRYFERPMYHGLV